MFSLKKKGIEPDINAIDIWLTNLADVSDSMRKLYVELLVPSELVRYKRFIVRSAATQFLVARALLRTTLSRYADVAYRDWVFEVNPYGKPYVIHPHDGVDLHFNISHTEGLVACVVSRNYVVGVDIENSLRDLDNLTSDPSIFATSEIATLQQLPAVERKEHFFSLWTLKEAYIKARGMGLSIPLNAFSFEIDDNCARIRFSNRCYDDPAHWTFFRSSPSSDHKLALAIWNLNNDKISIALHSTVPLE